MNETQKLFLISVVFWSLLIYLVYMHTTIPHETLIKCHKYFSEDTGKDECKYYKERTENGYGYPAFLVGLGTFIFSVITWASWESRKPEYNFEENK